MDKTKGDAAEAVNPSAIPLVQCVTDFRKEDRKNDSKSGAPTVVVQKRSTTRSLQVHEMKTPFGLMQVVVEGDVSKPCLFTYHDVGLNRDTCFQQFFNCARAERELLVNDLTIVHITAPGQHLDAEDIPSDTKEMTTDGLVETIELARTTLGVDIFFGVGVGAGAYLMLAYAARHRGNVIGLCLFGATSRALGWIEWGKRWMSWLEEKIWGTDSKWKQHFVERWLGWDQEGTDIQEFYGKHIDTMNQGNLTKFLDAYQARTDITQELKQISCPLLFFVGDNTPYDNEMVHITSKIENKQAYLEQITCDRTGILLTEHRPHFVLPALDLFFQAMGYFRITGGITSW